MGFELQIFKDNEFEADYLEWLVEEQSINIGIHFSRLWQCSNLVPGFAIKEPRKTPLNRLNDYCYQYEQSNWVRNSDSIPHLVHICRMIVAKPGAWGLCCYTIKHLTDLSSKVFQPEEGFSAYPLPVIVCWPARCQNNGRHRGSSHV